ncbi:MAG: type II toxin-antitoxin system VapC family toxin [Stackebrandtia sp.]
MHVSAASVWGLTVKSMLGKVTIPGKLTERLENQGLVVVPVNAAHAEGLSEFPELVRHDPFDRLLVSQAHHDNLRLLTADQVLLGLGKNYIVDAVR